LPIDLLIKEIFSLAAIKSHKKIYL